jgi:nitrate reductase cytochrome c-type subunit
MQADNPLRHAKHVFRIGVILLFLIVAIVLGRAIFVPDSWGKTGWYRHDNIAEQMAKRPQHGGNESCQGCHEEEFATHEEASHASVRCEVCHGPVAIHAEGDKKTAEMPRNRSKDWCLTCHRQLDARPESFPQIEPALHVEENGGDWGDEVCLDCHAPHAPLEGF